MNKIMNVTDNEENGNFDLQQLMNITGQTAMNLNYMGKQLGVIASTVNSMTDDINSLKEDMVQLKENEEITTTQQEMIMHSARKRVLEIIGNDAYEIAKYMRIFIQSLYKDARMEAGLGSKISRTKKCNYQRCIDYIEAWIPSGGCSSLKARADENAKARVKARQLGYLEQKKNKSNKK